MKPAWRELVASRRRARLRRVRRAEGAAAWRPRWPTGWSSSWASRPRTSSSRARRSRRRCAEVGRDPAELHVWWQTTVNFADTVEEAMERSLGVNTSWMTMRGLQGKQIPEEIHDDARAVQRRHGERRRGVPRPRPWPRARLTREGDGDLRLDHLARARLLGPARGDRASASLEFRRSGMTRWQFYVAPFHGDRDRLHRTFAGGVIPALQPASREAPVADTCLRARAAHRRGAAARAACARRAGGGRMRFVLRAAGRDRGRPRRAGRSGRTSGTSRPWILPSPHDDRRADGGHGPHPAPGRLDDGEDDARGLRCSRSPPASVSAC